MTEPIETRRGARRAAKGASGQTAQSVRHARAGKRAKRMGIFGFIGVALAVVLVSATSVAAIAAWDVVNGAHTVDLGTTAKIGAIDGGFNVLIVGSDTRKGQGNFGVDPGSSLNDVNILLHVSADHKNATAVSIPRDMVVPIADCQGGGGGWTGPINATLSDGGLPCIVKTVEELTGMSIPYAGLITFDGVIDLSKAVGGVRVCVASSIDDPYTDLHLTAGWHTISGWTALEFLRTRHGVGDGSDLGRISNQQVFLSALMRKIKDENLLANPLTVYSMAKAVVSNMTLSTSLNSPDVIASMAMALKGIDLSKIVFVQYPGSTGGTGVYAGKVQPDEQAAAALFTALQADKPVSVTGGLGRGSTTGATPTPTPSVKASTSATGSKSGSTKSTATPTPTPAQTAIPLDSNITGQTADQFTCSKGN